MLGACLWVDGSPRKEREAADPAGVWCCRSSIWRLPKSLCIPTAASCSSEKAFELNRNNYFDLAIPEVILPSAQTPSSILCLKSGDNQTTKQILCKYHYLIYLFYFVPLLFFFFSILAVMKEQKTPTMLGLLTTCDLLGSCTNGTFNSSRNSSRMRH